MPPPARIAWEKGASLIAKVKGYYFGKKEQPPMISEQTALLCALLFTLLYVAPFYLSPTLRTSPLTSRDAPTVIKARIRAVAFSCIASTAVAVYILLGYGHADARDVVRLFAMWPIHPLDCLKTLALVCVLFTGPLYETIVVDGAWRNVSFHTVKETLWDSLPGLRNYVIAPWSEELVFRSLVLSLYLLAKVSPTRMVFLTPLIFGVAHLHHLVEFVQAHTPAGRRTPPSNVLLMGLVRSLFQFTYTSLFGFFAAFCYLRTGNVFAAITAHTFCNYMGLPRVWGKVGQVEEWDVTPDVAQGKRDDSSDKGQGTNEKETLRNSVQSMGIAWTVTYYVLLVAGAFGFYKLLWTATESSNALVTF